jgi:prepilin-type processing-associated H-X9-DG protein
VTANGVGGNNSFSRLSRVRPMFLCPDAPGQGLNASDHSSISHYGSHPRIMPSLGPGLAPYKLSHIKRSSEVGLIFEASLYNRNGVNNASGVGAGPPDPTDVWTQANTIPVLTQMNNGGVTGTPSGTSKLLDTPNNPPKYQSNDPVVLIPGTVFVPKLVTNVDNVPKYYSNIRFRHMKNTVTNVLMADGHVQSFHLNTQTFLSDLLQKNVNVNP